MRNLFRSNPYTFLWIVLSIFTFILLNLFRFYPGLVEKIYFRTLFQWIRLVYDHTIGYLPIPTIYLILLIVITILIYWISVFFRHRKSQVRASVFQLGINVIALACCLATLFYWLWGFNYMRPSFEDMYHLEVTELTEDELFAELSSVTYHLTKLRDSISEDTLALTSDFVPTNIETLIRDELEDFLKTLDVPVFGRARVRKLLPKGLLLRFGTAGIYIPHAIEGHIDAGLHPVTWPYTMTHEMFHAYGFTDEGTCELLAYLSGRDHKDPFMQYSAYMGYWRYLLSDARRSNPERFHDFLKELSPSLIQDLRAISAYSNRYPDLMPKLRDLIYDNYLKSHGIKEGMASYSRIILLVKAWERREERNGNGNDNGNDNGNVNGNVNENGNGNNNGNGNGN